ncbi:MAG: Multi-sensor signal transduction histidine kinase [Candidatus Moranbacteria bacterium GW2011_GWF1_44_4]|nr:MAG: Multi-sensor signal transduction histidine kinase [Candidatus Moranbacteria bacterium GW2011_GWF1_44_4]
MFWKFLDDINFVARCKKYNIGMWQCPNFLFLVMGFLTVVSMFGTYFASKSFDDETVTIVSVTIVAAIIVTIGSLIIRGVERIAEANVMKNEFISIVSHQLCSPLSAIKWNMEMLENDEFTDYSKLTSKQVIFLKNVKEANDKMLKLVNQLLEVNRIDEGRAVLKHENVDLGEIADQAISELKDLISEREVEVKKRIAPDLPPVSADAAGIKTAIKNLISNAIKYSRQKGEVEVDLKANGRKILLTVKDRGVGIPRYQHRKVFEKFFRSANEARYRTDGIGLGLYLARAIVENLGGKLWFESEAGKGSTFFVSIPVVQK